MTDKPVIVIDNEESDDWMKSLPGYSDEVRLHEELARKHQSPEISIRVKDATTVDRAKRLFEQVLDEEQKTMLKRWAKHMNGDDKVSIRIKGGPGSGHHGHRGRPGKVGGSLPGTGSIGALYPLDDGEFAELMNAAVEPYYTPESRLAEHFDTGLAPKGRFGHGKYIWPLASDEERSEVKAHIVDDISKDAATSPKETNMMLKAWARSSNDDSWQSLVMQKAVSDEFDIEMSKWQQGKLEGVTESRNKVIEYLGVSVSEHSYQGHQAEYYGLTESQRIFSESDRMRSVLRTMYSRTQEQLKEAGYGEDDYVILFRGIGTIRPDYSINSGDTFTYRGNAMESWTLSPDIAGRFGNIVTAKVPIRNILCTARTGYGCLVEGEVVILNGTDGVVSWVSERSGRSSWE